MKIIGFLGIASGILVGWLAWFPIKGFLFSFIPSTASYAWVGKLIIIGVIGWGGGITIPLILIIGGIVALIKL